jgi:phenylacetate-CoA ligase
MNPFLNPSITIPFLKRYYLNPGRIERLNPKQLERYRDKAFKKMFSYAYSVPLYKKKYKEADIHPSDIREIKDIQKIPFISRKEIRDVFPEGITPPNFNREKGHVICTGGTTGKYCCTSGSEPVCIYTDFPSLLESVLTGIREHRFLGYNWKKSRIANVGNFNPYKYDDVFDKAVVSHLKPFYSLKNTLTMQASGKTREILEKLDTFQPDVIISYPAIYQDLSYLKRKGLGKNIKPKLLLSGGQLLDEFTKSYVEDTFGCRLLNMYGSCESGANIAYECPEGGWHIHSDYFHLEAVDENMEVVAPGERGRLVLTKLWGKGTPLIRYTGMEDWVTLGNGKKCTCGLSSPILKRPLEGRIMSNIILPNGKVYPPTEFLFITSVLKDLKAYKVRRFQIIQKKIDEIEIHLVIDDDLRNTGVPFDEIAEMIRKIYAEKTGPNVKITVKEVKETESDLDSGKPAPLVISYVNVNDACELLDR